MHSNTHLERAIVGVTDAMLAQAAQFLDARKAMHGNLRMEADGGDGGAPPGDPGTPPAGEPPAQPAGDPPPAFQWDGKVESLPADVQKVIRDARDDAAKARTNAKATAAQEARDALAQDIGKALGLVKDGDQAPDPAQLTQQLTAAQQAQRQTAVELAVFRNAAAAGADPARLLDSNAFLTALRDIDPADGEAIKTAITTAIAQNAWLKAGRAPGASGADHAGGSGEGPRKPQTLEEAIALKMAR